MKKKLWILIGLGIFVVLLSAIIYWFYFSKPASFPTNEQLVEEINSIFPEAAASVIQDTIPIDEHHVVVPFISDKGDYSLSYWVWQKDKWRAESIHTNGSPMVWKIDRNDPSSFRFVWNIHPDDQLGSLHFYLIRDRGYQVTEGVEHYYPRVQMDTKVSLQENTYGVLRLPDDWIAFMDASMKVETAKQHDLFFNDFFPEQYMSFGWIPYNQADKEAYPERSVNGSGYSNGDLEHVMILDKGDIEIP